MRNPFFDRGCHFPVEDQTVDGLGGGMRWVQDECLIGQRLGFPPIGFYNGVSVLDQCIGQNGAGKSVVLIQRLGFAQQLNRRGGFLLGEKFLAFGDQPIRFGFTLEAVLGELFQR